MRRTRTMAAIMGLMLALMTAFVPAARSVGAQATPAATPVVADNGLAAATAWLVSQQGEDGSFLGFSGEPDAGTTVDSLLALVAAQNAGIDVGTAIDDAVAYLASSDIALVYTQTGVGQAAKLALGLIAAGQDVDNFAGVSPLTILDHGQNADTGIYGTGLFDHALVMLALVASGQDVPASAIDALANSQADNGGWGWDGTPDDANADSNTTSLVIQALVAAGEGDSDLVTNGVAYLQSTIVDGGAAYNDVAGSAPDANSTAYVAQGLLAVGEDASGVIGDLAGFQNEDGSLFFNAETPGPNLLATVQAIPSLADAVFPIAPVAPAGTPVAFFPIRDLLAA